MLEQSPHQFQDGEMIKPTILRVFTFCTFMVTSAVVAEEKYPPLDVLLSTESTTIGQKFSYPDGPAKMTAAIVTMMPGQKTGWHQHDVPLFAYILEGELTVDYGPAGVKTYRSGDSFMEAFLTDHNGENSGGDMVRILAVFAGGVGTPNTTTKK
ncbi:MAG: cupin [Rhodobacteraceae bacterium]|nr:cupin [Paracoccaceae bacterium]